MENRYSLCYSRLKAWTTKIIIVHHFFIIIIITTMTSEIKRGEIPIETRLSKVNKRLKSIEKKVLGRLDNIEKELRRIKYAKQEVESYIYDTTSDSSS